MKKKFEKFIEGETVNLVIPNLHAVKNSKWASWFNDAKFTRYLTGHGMFPNTKKNQKIILNKMIMANQKKEGLFLLISEKNSEKIVGVCSLSKIDWVNRSAYMAVVIAPERKKNFVFNSVEAKALLTKHAFEKFNLNKIKTSQVLELSEWQKYSFILGYKVEGISRNYFLRDHKYYDVCFHSCLLEDYNKAKKKLGENYWPGKTFFFKMMMQYPKGDVYKKISKLIKKENEIYENKLNKII